MLAGVCGAVFFLREGRCTFVMLVTKPKEKQACHDQSGENPGENDQFMSNVTKLKQGHATHTVRQTQSDRQSDTQTDRHRDRHEICTVNVN